MIMSVSALLLSSCGTYEATGAYTGARFGSMIGSAIGGLSGGWRGSDLGTLVGLAGGAVVGAAIGHAADKQSERAYEEHVYQREQRQAARQASRQDSRNYADEDQSGFDPTNSGDDRIFLEGTGNSGGFGGGFGSNAATIGASLEIRNAHLVDDSRDDVLTRGEQARMVFEIYNNSSKPAFHVLPEVSEVSGNKHIHISENVMIESIAPRQAIRYTAMVKADNRVREGEAVIRIAVCQDNREVTSQTKTFRLRTTR